MGDAPNIVITGYMGTGKTSVASALAERLGRPFVDLDSLIEQRAGMSIPEVFERHGEDVFRRLERDVCAEVFGSGGQVVATGGGALVDARNRDAALASGHVICLDCEPQELAHRVRGDAGRPMLWGDDPEAKLRALLVERRPAYARIPLHVDTTLRSIPQVVEEILSMVARRPRVWNVSTGGALGGGESYPVHLQPGGLEHVGALLRAHGVMGRVAIVSDERVWPLHGRALVDGLVASGYEPHRVVLPSGEEHKTLDTVRGLYDAFVTAELDRGSAIVALGGGVITDMAGFAAATYMRGVPFVPLPTTLLGMIDASVGGKVAVDLPAGKNLVGAFVRPLLVLLDTDTLATLPDGPRRCGVAEMIKAGIIADSDLFVSFEGSGVGDKDLRWQVERALQVKIDIVEEDPLERGRRAVLNLGHTFAHAFEVMTDYALPHGLAVSIGLCAAAHLSSIRGWCTASTVERVERVLVQNDLPVRFDAADPSDVFDAMGRDKKRHAGRLRFILMRDIGDVFIDAEVGRDEALEALERIR